MTKSKIFIISLSVVIAIIIGIFIWFTWRVASPLPPDSTPDERQEWIELLSDKEFVIDKATKDVRLKEFLYEKIKGLEIKRHDKELDYLECVFISKEDENETYAQVYESGETLICNISGSSCPIWFEDGQWPVVVLQGEEERLIFNPVNYNEFR